MGKKVLLIDADPQGDLTSYMGWYNQDELQYTISDLMEQEINDIPIDSKNAILHHEENVDLIPSNLDFSVMEMRLINAMNREQIMKRCIENLKKDYDYIIIDCMPSLGMITVNALTSADKVIIPVQTQYLAVKNMGHLLKTISNVKKHLNHKLDIGGVLLTLVDKRTNLSRETKQELQENYGSIVKIFETQIPIAVKTAESTSQGKSIFSYDKNSKVAEAYSSFAREIENVRTKEKNAITKNYER